jgi:hypothetical protein
LAVSFFYVLAFGVALWASFHTRLMSCSSAPAARASDLTVKLPTDLDGPAINPKLTRYSVELKTKILTQGGSRYTYFDQARAIRE